MSAADRAAAEALAATPTEDERAEAERVPTLLEWHHRLAPSLADPDFDAHPRFTRSQRSAIRTVLADLSWPGHDEGRLYKPFDPDAAAKRAGGQPPGAMRAAVHLLCRHQLAAETADGVLLFDPPAETIKALAALPPEAEEGFGLHRPTESSRSSQSSKTSEDSQTSATPVVAPEPEALPGVPPFPVWVLPPRIREFVERGAEAIGCPADYVALPLLAALEMALGNAAGIEIKPGWVTYPGSWYGVIGDSGTGKTPAMKYVLDQFQAIQSALWEAYRRDRETWESLPKDEKTRPPVAEQIYVTDSTMEALYSALAHSRGVLLWEDEIRRRILALDAYRRGGDRQNMLTIWANGAVNIARKGTEPVFIPRPVAPMVGGIQPGVLPRLAGEGGESDSDDGWLPRFLLAYPDVEHRGLTRDGIDWNRANEVRALLERLRNLAPPPDPNDPAERAMDAPGGVCKLSDAAWEAFKAWHDDNAASAAAAAGLEKQWLLKAPTHVARFALVLHHVYGAGAGVAVAAETMDRAIALLEYFRGHLARVLPSFEANAQPLTPADRVARTLDRLGREAEGRWVAKSDILRAARTFKASDLDTILADLGGAGRVEARIVPGQGVKPKHQWRTVVDGGVEDDGEGGRA